MAFKILSSLVITCVERKYSKLGQIVKQKVNKLKNIKSKTWLVKGKKKKKTRRRKKKKIDHKC